MPEMVKEYKITNSLGNDNEDVVQAIPTSSGEELDVANEGEGGKCVCLTPVKKREEISRWSRGCPHSAFSERKRGTGKI